MPISRSKFCQGINLKVESQSNWNTTSLATVTDCYLSFLRATTCVTSILDNSDGVNDYFFLHTSKDSSISLPTGLLTLGVFVFVPRPLDRIPILPALARNVCETCDRWRDYEIHQSVNGS